MEELDSSPGIFIIRMPFCNTANYFKRAKSIKTEATVAPQNLRFFCLCDLPHGICV